MNLLSQSLRALLRTPGFLMTAVLTLALGVGATTAIFTVLNAVVLSPLPYPGAERLVRVENQVPVFDPERNWGLSPAGYFHYRENARSLEELGVYFVNKLSLTGEGSAERVEVAAATDGVFTVLGARPHLGGLITAQHDEPRDSEEGSVLPGPSAMVAVLGYDFWMRRYGGEADVVGRTIHLNGMPVEVIGVMERGFDLPNAGVDVDVWMPMGLNPAAPATNWHTFEAVGRLRDGAAPAGAQAELEQLTSRFTEIFSSAYDQEFMDRTGFSPVVIPLRDAVVGDLSRTLWVLLAAVGLVMLIASANVANLFLVRTEGRQRELAIRTAMGATRGHLGRQFFSEGLVLAVLGGGLGLVMASLGVSALIAVAPEGLPRVSEIALDGTVVAFAAGLSLVVGLAVGFFPMFRFGSRVSADALREAGRSSTSGRGSNATRNLLVVGQVAMALVLLASAGLLLQSFQKLRSVDPGLDPAGVLAMELNLPSANYRGYEAAAAFHRELLTRVRALPGVESASFTDDLPLAGSGMCASVFPEAGPAAGAGEPPCVPVSTFVPGLFETLRIPLEGRTPGWGEVSGGTAGAVVSRALADRLWPGEDPMGKGIRGNGPGAPYYRVVGVSGNVRYDGLDRAPAEMVYFPPVPIEGAGLWSPLYSGTLVVRSANGRPEALTGVIRSTIAELDPEVPIANVRTMERVVADSMARTSFAMLLLAIAAAVALALGAVGLYGVLAYVVGQRRTEIGIRMALGAQVEEVARMIVRHSLLLVAAGVVVGVLGALAVTRVLQSLLFEVDATDPLTLGVVSLLLVGVALLASYLPARRATRVDPMVALRAE